jgi:hypothetical protein
LELTSRKQLSEVSKPLLAKQIIIFLESDQRERIQDLEVVTSQILQQIVDMGIVVKQFEKTMITQKIINQKYPGSVRVISEANSSF